LGIDYRKESEVWRVLKNEDGLHSYNGFFHFKGSFEGKDCMVPLPSGGATFDLTEFGAYFSIGFRGDNSLAYFKDNTDLVQVEFETKIPWSIDKTLESDG